MLEALEFSGRLHREDGKPVVAGVYDLRFRLHPTPDGEAFVWEEIHRGVKIATGGLYTALLGRTMKLPVASFEAEPMLYLSVGPVRASKEAKYSPERAIVTGGQVRIAAGLERLEARVGVLERRFVRAATAKPTRKVLGRRVRRLHQRLQALEAGGGPLEALSGRMQALEARLERVDGEEGRIVHLEDELEDIVGPDGDVVDLIDRFEALEKRLLQVVGAMEERVGALEGWAPPLLRVEGSG